MQAGAGYPELNGKLPSRYGGPVLGTITDGSVMGYTRWLVSKYRGYGLVNHVKPIMCQKS